MAGSPATDVKELDPEEGPAATDVACPRGGRPRDEARDQAILEAALDLLAEVGYDAMSIESIATRAKVSKATIYRRWPGKAELVVDALRSRHEPHMVDPEDTGNLRGDLLAAVNNMLEQIAGMDGALICGMATAVRADAQLGQMLLADKKAYSERLAGLIISRAQARGELPADADPGPILKVAPGVALFRQMTGEPLDRAFAEYLVDDVVIPLLSS
ncbi:MAG TPA: TetR/AcrR family transcriptional regulator [Acidimicrobiales bacterium]|nr:TetR/AcrR family transcriptional regulator [Acidimicrobiales bacterium]